MSTKEKLSFDTTKDFAENYKFLIGSIQPRPIAWISTLNENQTINLAPFSFFTAVSAMPMIIAFCPMIRVSDGEKKDTVKNIERTKEFVVNFVSESLALKCNQTAQELPYGKSELDLIGLQTIPSFSIATPRILECPIHFECKLRDILNYGDHKGSGRLITGEVMKVHVDPELYDSGKIITDVFKPVGRGSGNDWYNSSSRFELERLSGSQIQK